MGTEVKNESAGDVPQESSATEKTAPLKRQEIIDFALDFINKTNSLSDNETPRDKALAPLKRAFPLKQYPLPEEAYPGTDKDPLTRAILKSFYKDPVVLGTAKKMQIRMISPLVRLNAVLLEADGEHDKARYLRASYTAIKMYVKGLNPDAVKTAEPSLKKVESIPAAKEDVAVVASKKTTWVNRLFKGGKRNRAEMVVAADANATADAPEKAAAEKDWRSSVGGGDTIVALDAVSSHDTAAHGHAM